MADHRYVGLRRAGFTVALLLVGTVALLWFWNGTAQDLFGAPAAQFKHALATVLVLYCGGRIVRIASGRPSRAVSQNG